MVIDSGNICSFNQGDILLEQNGGCVKMLLTFRYVDDN
jgi:hypothetical protein